MDGSKKITRGCPTKKKNGKTRKYYCPNGVITNNFPSKNIFI
jgi:hypothetical protein